MAKFKTPALTSADLLTLWPYGVVEYRFHPVRKWKFDWAMPEWKIAVELDGYNFHSPIKQWHRDIERSNEALLLGWKVFRVTHADVRAGRADELMKRMLDTFMEVKA
jgi:very-short-patch-repair endonuclease